MYGMGGGGMGGMGGMDPTMMIGCVCCVMLLSAGVLLFYMQTSKKEEEARAAAARAQAAAAAASSINTVTEPDVPMGGPVLSTGDADWDIADVGAAAGTPEPTDGPGKTKKKDDEKKKSKGKNDKKSKDKKDKKTSKKVKAPRPTPAGKSTLKQINPTTVRQTWSDGTVRNWTVKV